MNTRFSLYVLLCLLVIMIAIPLWAAGPGGDRKSGERRDYYSNNVEGYNVDPMMNQKSKYYDEDMAMMFGPGRNRNQQQQQQQPQTIIVRHGTRVYCAHCGQFLLDEVYLDEVELKLSTNYFDDGVTGNDELKNDGLPSNIIIKRDVLGEYCVKKYAHP